MQTGSFGVGVGRGSVLFWPSKAQEGAHAPDSFLRRRAVLRVCGACVLRFSLSVLGSMGACIGIPGLECHWRCSSIPEYCRVVIPIGEKFREASRDT